MSLPLARTWIAPKQTFRFQFMPFFFEDIPQTWRGALVVFLQLFTADDWSRELRCRKISNVTTAIVAFR